MLLGALPWSDGQVRNCDFGVTMVVGPRLAVSLNHLGSHKYWIHDSCMEAELNVLSIGEGIWGVRLPKSQQGAAPPPFFLRPPHAALSRRRAPPPRDRTCFDHRDEEIPFVSNSSVLLVQADKGFVLPIVDLIRRSTAAYLLKCRFPCETGRSQAPRRQQVTNSLAAASAQLVARWEAAPRERDAAHGAASMRPCAARYVGGGRRPAILVTMRRLFCPLGFVSGLSRAAHEVFGPIFDIGPILFGAKLILKF
ncbi:hypothetical protein F511_30457 [Dorcoceras hygrometricum]|uniref:Uncharacterized protein n=1 Tax=Dorcoceras hygrometricum TaxID=472368 RepID=A0A2Z7BYI6_9LAMI|nr:hypothetical protein F511_30457 [Dorcoceras hygrometricum]